jgi:uncharacterized membrane protein
MTISRFFLNFQCQLQNETDFTVYLHVFLNGLVSMFVCFSWTGTRDGYIVMFREWIRFSLILSPITGLSLTLLYTTHEEIIAWKRGQGRRTVDAHRETNLTRYHHGLCREGKFLKFLVSRLSEMAFKEPSLPLSLVPFINPFIMICDSMPSVSQNGLLLLIDRPAQSFFYIQLFFSVEAKRYSPPPFIIYSEVPPVLLLPLPPPAIEVRAQ